MSTANYMNWSTFEVSNWLSSLNLHQLIPNFERMQITGAQLGTLSDQDLRQKLWINKPAELIALKGAINKILEDAMEQNRHIGSPRLVAGPNSMTWERAGSYGEVPKNMTLPATFENPRLLSYVQPILTQGSASELIDQSKYSGWIRKQGGSYKSCES